MSCPRLPVPIDPHSATLVVIDPGAVASPVDPASVVRGWAKMLGFDGASVVLLHDRASFPPAGPGVWSTWGDAWQRAYRTAGWIDVDPRVEATLAHDRPCLWDGATIVADGRRARFLREAALVGIRCGLALPIRSPSGRGIVAFDSSNANPTQARREAMLARLGEAIWVAEAIQSSRCTVQPAPEAAGLSMRERSCLALSAHGFTSRDIAVRLGISTRTVGFHIGNVLLKLGAANRHEAIAKAAARGWLSQ